MEKKKQALEDFPNPYAKAFNFTAGDLEANRAGFMSHRQKRLQRRLIVWEMFLSLILISSYLFLMTMQFQALLVYELYFGLLLLAIVNVFVGIAFIYLNRTWFRKINSVRADIREAKVLSLIQVTHEQIDNELNSKQSSLLELASQRNFYILAHSKRLLSLEETEK